mmetsp:Transcript_18312/g.45873  ORF Transcript_18312/g.45873 Transcript_18312/m.45873 type:complete len:128 (-) Transcript_18312:201-584(-)
MELSASSSFVGKCSNERLIRAQRTGMRRDKSSGCHSPLRNGENGATLSVFLLFLCISRKSCALAALFMLVEDRDDPRVDDAEGDTQRVLVDTWLLTLLSLSSSTPLALISLSPLVRRPFFFEYFRAR